MGLGLGWGGVVTLEMLLKGTDNMARGTGVNLCLLSEVQSRQP